MHDSNEHGTAMQQTPRSAWVSALGALLVFFLICVAGQAMKGSFETEPAAGGDEAAHYVTGVMVKEYLLHGLPASPMRFAERYYLQYPQVAIGHWPPGFYGMQGVWMAVFGTSRVVSLLLIALMTAVMALQVFWLVRKEHGFAAALLAGLAVEMLPLMQVQWHCVMSDLPGAFTSFAATVLFARYMDTRQWQDSLWFGIASSLAILTRNSCWYMALVPPFVLLFTREFKALARPSFWVSVPVVACLGLPWAYIAGKMMFNDVPAELEQVTRFVVLLRYLRILATNLGPVLLALAAVGFWKRVVNPANESKRSWLLASLAAFIAAQIAFHVLIKMTEPRFILGAFPAMIPLAFAGAAELVPVLTSRFGIPRGAILAVLIATSLPPFFLPAPHYDTAQGMRQVVADLVANPRPGGSPAILVDSVPGAVGGEGTFIAEFAALQPRPERYILRTSKVMSEARWEGTVYRTLFSSTAEVEQYLESIPIGIIVVDETAPVAKRKPHSDQLAACIREYPTKWKLVRSYPAVRLGRTIPDGIKVYEGLGMGAFSPDRVKVKMTYSLGHEIDAKGKTQAK